jgi:hypothetical protein
MSDPRLLSDARWAEIESKILGVTPTEASVLDLLMILTNDRAARIELAEWGDEAFWKEIPDDIQERYGICRGAVTVIAAISIIINGLRDADTHALQMQDAANKPDTGIETAKKIIASFQEIIDVMEPRKEFVDRLVAHGAFAVAPINQIAQAAITEARRAGLLEDSP